MFQSSCSELLVDTKIEDPAEFLAYMQHKMEIFAWEVSPPLKLEDLEQMQKIDESENYDESEFLPRPIVYDSSGNRAYIEYGNNGYIHTGFRLDSSCNHGDHYCFPLFKELADDGGEVIACDGGSTECYDEWETDPEGYMRQWGRQ